MLVEQCCTYSGISTFLLNFLKKEGRLDRSVSSVGFTGLVCQLESSTPFNEPAEKEADYAGSSSAHDEHGIEKPVGGVLTKGP